MKHFYTALGDTPFAEDNRKYLQEYIVTEKGIYKSVWISQNCRSRMIQQKDYCNIAKAN